MEDHIVESPLEAWPGSITLPDPNAFSGVHWRAWKNAVNKDGRSGFAMTHLYCYAGLEMIDAHGGWDMEVSIDEVRGWEGDPEAERTKLVAWLGRTMMEYMNGIMDPKE